MYCYIYDITLLFRRGNKIINTTIELYLEYLDTKDTASYRIATMEKSQLKYVLDKIKAINTRSAKLSVLGSNTQIATVLKFHPKKTTHVEINYGQRNLLPLFTQIIYLKITDIPKNIHDKLLLDRTPVTIEEIDPIDPIEVDFQTLFNSFPINLTALDLNGNRIGPRGATALAEALKTRNITQLSLINNQITDEGAIALAENVNSITHLNLVGNWIGHRSAEALAKNNAISHIDLWGNDKLMDHGNGFKQLTENGKNFHAEEGFFISTDAAFGHDLRSETEEFLEEDIDENEPFIDIQHPQSINSKKCCIIS